MRIFVLVFCILIAACDGHETGIVEIDGKSGDNFWCKFYGKADCKDETDGMHDAGQGE